MLFLATIFYIRINILAWPLSLIAISINLFLYCQKGIYGDMSLQFLYLGMTIYGWYQWKFGGNNHAELPVQSITPKAAKSLILVGIIAICLTALLLGKYTNSQVPVLDATTTVLSIIAQWLICRKVIQNWVIWFVVDSMYAGLYFYKHIPAHALLQIVYLSMAVLGYLRWKKELDGVGETSYNAIL